MKYNSKIIYRGNLLKNKDGINNPYKEKVLLIYDENEDVFYDYVETLNSFISIDLEKLSKEQLIENKNIIKSHTYPYANSGVIGQIYVDESSIEVLFENNNQKPKLN